MDEFDDLFGEDDSAEKQAAKDAAQGAKPPEEAGTPKARRKSATPAEDKPKTPRKAKEAPVATATKKTTKKTAKARKNGTPGITSRNLKPGTTLYANHKGKQYTCKVVKDADGVGYQVGKNVFNSPSSAGTSITGIACNGWRFWSLTERSLRGSSNGTKARSKKAAK